MRHESLIDLGFLGKLYKKNVEPEEKQTKKRSLQVRNSLLLQVL